MIDFEIDTVIPRPIEEVFDRLVDIDGYSNWLPESEVFVDCRKTSEGPVDVGTKYRDETRYGVIPGEVVAFERPTKVTFENRARWHGRSLMETRPSYVLEPVDGGTRVRLLAEAELHGLFKLVRPFVSLRARKERSRTLEALARSLD